MNLLVVNQLIKSRYYSTEEHNCPFVISVITEALLFCFSAPISPSHPIPACWGKGYDSGPHLPHPASPLLPWNVSQHHDVGPTGTPKHSQALEPELPAACTPTTALCCPLLQRGDGPCLHVVWTFSCFFFLFLMSYYLLFFLYLQDLSKSPKSVKKLLPKRKPERKQSEEEFALRKSTFKSFVKLKIHRNKNSVFQVKGIAQHFGKWLICFFVDSWMRRSIPLWHPPV